MKTKLVWITPNAEQVIIDCARVSNPANQGKEGDRLIRYLLKHKHFSPFEMASACIEINTTRDIARQILRHRSFSFQEFSQRYAEVEELPVYREFRLQDLENRQNSIEEPNHPFTKEWLYMQEDVYSIAKTLYKEALQNGVAKEVARALLPEGLTPSKLYMSGTIRSWLHYVEVRHANGTQKEHIKIAKEVNNILASILPNVFTTMEIEE